MQSLENDLRNLLRELRILKNTSGTLPRKKKESENIHVKKWVQETYSEDQTDSENSEIIIPAGPNHVHAAMSDSDSESPLETGSNTKTKVRSSSKSRPERQRSSTPKIPTPQKGSQQSPKPVQFRPTTRVAELMSKFSYFSTNQDSENTIKSSMKHLTPNEQILISEVISNILHDDRSKQNNNQSSKYLSYRPWEWESSLEDIPSILEEEVDESIFSDASSSFDEKNNRYGTSYE